MDHAILASGLMSFKMGVKNVGGTLDNPLLELTFNVMTIRSVLNLCKGLFSSVILINPLGTSYNPNNPVSLEDKSDCRSKC